MVERLLSPAQRLARDLQPWSAFLVLPVFAFANAGVAVTVGARELLAPLGLGVMLGLLVGKPVGISLGAWLSVRAGLAAKPDDLRWPHVVGAGVLCGIGFTMAFFVADVVFDDPPVLALAKLSTLTASLLAAVVGWAILQRTPKWRESGSTTSLSNRAGTQVLT
jgi:NhaA family Na+:H+ antiporter